MEVLSRERAEILASVEASKLEFEARLLSEDVLTLEKGRQVMSDWFAMASPDADRLRKIEILGETTRGL